MNAHCPICGTCTLISFGNHSPNCGFPFAIANFGRSGPQFLRGAKDDPARCEITPFEAPRGLEKHLIST
jgi:hypothetical protein